MILNHAKEKCSGRNRTERNGTEQMGRQILKIILHSTIVENLFTSFAPICMSNPILLPYLYQYQCGGPFHVFVVRKYGGGLSTTDKRIKEERRCTSLTFILIIVWRTRMTPEIHESYMWITNCEKIECKYFTPFFLFLLE